jgi:hypothetical protein
MRIRIEGYAVISFFGKVCAGIRREIIGEGHGREGDVKRRDLSNQMGCRPPPHSLFSEVTFSALDPPKRRQEPFARPVRE